MHALEGVRGSPGNDDNEICQMFYLRCAPHKALCGLRLSIRQHHAYPFHALSLFLGCMLRNAFFMGFDLEQKQSSRLGQFTDYPRSAPKQDLDAAVMI